MDVEIKTMPELRVAAVRHVGPYTEIAPAFERLGRIAGGAGLFNQPGATMVGLYHDDPRSTPADQLRSDAGVVVPAGLRLPAGLTEEHIPAGRYASALYVGPYEQLPDVWMRLMGEWLPASGHRLGAGVSYELYENNPQDVPREKLRTLVRIPIASD